MTEPRRSTRARAREEAAPAAPETPSEKAAKGAKSTLKRKRGSIAVKDSTPGTPVGEAAQQGPKQTKQTLPLRIAEGQPLPTLAEPQPLHLSAAEWQNIQQSGVLSASLQRSRAVWVSGVNFRTFHKKHEMPKKVSERTEADKAGRTRQKEIEKNFPQVGGQDAQLVIEPHTFPIKLYAPKEGSRAAPKKMPPPPQQYGAWPNHSQHGQHSQHSQHSQHPPHYQPYNQAPYPPKQHSQPRPPPAKPVQQAPPQTAPGPASTPAPDPVIHMLAARAGTDPELKAVMKIVAAGQASKEQLEFFQTHINELTEILEKNKKAKAPMPLPPAPNTMPPKQHTPAPAAPKQQASTPAASKPSPAPAPPKQSPVPPKQSPAQTPPPPRPAPPTQQQQQQQPPKAAPTPTPTPKPFSPAPPHTHQQYAPSAQPRPPQPNTYPPKNYNQPPHYQQPPPHYAAPPPPRITYRPLTFEFVEGNGDRFYFPSYSFMEWLPNGSGAKFSFLVTKLNPKSEAAKPPPTPAPPQPPTAATVPPSTPGTANPPFPPAPGGPTATPTPAPTPSYIAPPRIEDFDERNDLKDIAFYQPVTVLVLTDEHEVKNALPRAIRPPSVVEKYMEEVFDTCKRAEETYLAFRLPRGGNVDAEVGGRSGEGTPGVATPGVDGGLGMGGVGATMGEKRRSLAGRPRKSVA